MIIKRETLNAVLPATTAEDTRYFLDAILAEPEKHRVLATDGHIMLIATDNYPYADADFPAIAGAEFHADPDPICISTAIAKSMIATMPKKPTIEILAAAQLSRNGSDATATLAATDLQAPRIATLHRDDTAKFPAYQRVLDVSQSTVRVTLSVVVLEAMIKSAKAVSKNKRVPLITLDVPTDKPEVCSQLGITIAGDTVTVTGVVMPCRT
jgi:hypothetical protein